MRFFLFIQKKNCNREHPLLWYEVRGIVSIKINCCRKKFGNLKKFEDDDFPI